jgi:hypothetical protein
MPVKSILFFPAQAGALPRRIGFVPLAKTTEKARENKSAFRADLFSRA